MKISVKNVIAGVVLLSVGYVGGAYLGLPQQNSDLNGGNISKAASAMQYQQMISKNPNAQSEASSVLSIMAKKTEQFNQLTSATIAAIKDVPELSEILDEISEYKSLARTRFRFRKGCT